MGNEMHAIPRLVYLVSLTVFSFFPFLFLTKKTRTIRSISSKTQLVSIHSQSIQS